MIGYYMTKSQVKSILSTFEVHFWAYVTFLGRFQTLCIEQKLHAVLHISNSFIDKIQLNNLLHFVKSKDLLKTSFKSN